MVLGGVNEARFQLNEETLWAGEPGNNNVPACKDVLPKIRDAIQDGNYKEAESMADKVLPWDPNRRLIVNNRQ